MAEFEFQFVFVLAIVYGTSYGLRFLEDYGIPVVAIEILAGIVFGSVLGIVNPSSPGFDFLVTLAAFGLLLIMFEAGLELDPELIRREPFKVGLIGGITFLVPFLSGVGFALSLGFSPFAAYLVGVTVSTTSLGLVHPLLTDLDLLEYEQGQLVLSITGLNDVLSIVALAYGIALTGAQPIVGIVAVTAVLVSFFVVIPVFFLDRLAKVAPSRLKDDPVMTSLLLTVALALVTERLGIHAVLGGFFAGLLLGELTHEGPDVETSMRSVVTLAATTFFFYVGLNFDVTAFFSASLVLILLVVAIGIGSKFVSGLVGGYIMRIGGKTTMLLASVMPGRLSISVAAAEIGRSRGIISGELYDAFIVLSILSVFISIGLFRYFVRYYPPDEDEKEMSDDAEKALSEHGG